MRMLIAAMGARGDVQPALALALALRAAGHEVVVSAPPDFASWAGRLGVTFVSTGASMEQLLKAHAEDVSWNPLRPLRTMRRVFGELVPAWFERTLAAADGAEVIVSASQFASRSVAEKLRIPCYGVAYSPTIVPSAHHPPPFNPWQRLPRWVNSACWSLFTLLVGQLMLRPMNAERAKMGLSPVRSFRRHMFEDLPYVLACDPVLAPPPPDWAGLDVTVTGPWFYEDPSSLPVEVEAFLNAGPAPVYVGFGSMVRPNTEQMTRAVIDGVVAGGRRLLVSAGWAGLGRGDKRSDVLVVDGHLPHAKLFRRVAAVVHHGGAGTTAAALRAGAAQVVVPHFADQFYYAHRLATLGLAPPPIPAQRLTAMRLTRAIDATLAMAPGVRAEAMSRLQENGGLARTVELIESRLAGRRVQRASARARSSIRS